MKIEVKPSLPNSCFLSDMYHAVGLMDHTEVFVTFNFLEVFPSKSIFNIYQFTFLPA